MSISKTHNYTSYSQYLTHQSSKAKQPAVRSFLFQKRQQRVDWFFHSFAMVVDRLPANASAICLGARFGEEVEALRRHGIEGAIGIDIEPYPPFVVPGDMNRLDYADDSFDFVYTNALDHAWDVAKFVVDVVRITRPNGVIMLHLPSGKPEEFETHAWGSPTEVAALFKKTCKQLIGRPVDIFHGLQHELTFVKDANVKRIL